MLIVVTFVDILDLGHTPCTRPVYRIQWLLDPMSQFGFIYCTYRISGIQENGMVLCIEQNLSHWDSGCRSTQVMSTWQPCNTNEYTVGTIREGNSQGIGCQPLCGQTDPGEIHRFLEIKKYNLLRWNEWQCNWVMLLLKVSLNVI